MEMEKYYLQIESYLLGELNDQELRAFEEALQQDPALLKAVDQIRDTQKRLAALKLRNQVRDVLKNGGDVSQFLPDVVTKSIIKN